jgi:hypothetical protein
MSNRILRLDDLNEHTLEDVLREVAEQRQTVTVRLPEGESVIIKPAPRLRPLPVLEGFVPEGWKDAIYQ